MHEALYYVPLCHKSVFMSIGNYDKPKQCIKKQTCNFADKSPYSQSYVFSSSHVWIWELDNKKGRVRKNWCLQTMVLMEKTLESLFDSMQNKPVNPKRNLCWIVTGRTGAEAKAPVLWPPDAKSWLTGKDPHAGKDWGQEEKGVTEDEMVGGHHWLNVCEFEQTPGDGEGQEGLACCRPRGHKELDTTERLNSHDWAT